MMFILCRPWTGHQRAASQNRDFPDILAELSLHSVSQKQSDISYHGDLSCAACLLQTRLRARNNPGALSVQSAAMPIRKQCVLSVILLTLLFVFPLFIYF